MGLDCLRTLRLSFARRAPSPQDAKANGTWGLSSALARGRYTTGTHDTRHCTMATARNQVLMFLQHCTAPMLNSMT